MAIASVHAQTFRDWRLLVVDDASDDGSFETLMSEFAHDERINFVQRRTRGLASAARQTGLERATAPWIATLDSDDFWHPMKLERQFELRGEADVVLCGHVWMRADGTPFQAYIPEGDSHSSLLLTANIDVLLARRELVLAAGGFIGDEHSPVLADETIDFYIRLLARAKCVVVPEVLAFCRSHNSSRMSDSLPAYTLQSVVNARASLLANYGEDRATLHARLGARYIGEGQLLVGFTWLVKSLLEGTFKGRWARFVRYSPYALRSFLVQPVRSVRLPRWRDK